MFAQVFIIDKNSVGVSKVFALFEASFVIAASAYRKPDNELNLPKIPVTPIGSIDAVKYLEKLGGNPVKEEWEGGLNITYRYGPGFRDEFSTR